MPATDPDVRLDTHKLDFLRAHFQDRAEKAVAALANGVVGHVHNDGLVPVATGKLRDSYSAAEIDRLNWGVGSDDPSAPHVEFGTRHVAPRPHFMPAIESERRQMPKAVAEMFNPPR